MKRVSVAELIERLERARGSAAGAILAFDCDGTLWPGDINEALFAAVLEQNGFRHDALAALAAEAASCGLPLADDPNALARALHEAHARGVYPEQPFLEMMCWVYGGLANNALDTLIGDVFARIDLAALVRSELRQVLAWADSRGVAAYLVSASPGFLVARAAELLAIPADRALGMNVVGEDGRLCPRLSGVRTYREGKLVRVRAAAAGAPILAAFGDSGFDAALLLAAELRVAVAPAPSLVAVADQIPDLCELVVTR